MKMLMKWMFAGPTYAIRVSFKDAFEPDANGNCVPCTRADEWLVCMHNCNVISKDNILDAQWFLNTTYANGICKAINESMSSLHASVELISKWQMLKWMLTGKEHYETPLAGY